MTGQNTKIRLLWFALGLTLGMLVTLGIFKVINARRPLKPEPLVSAQIFLDTDVSRLISIRNPNEAAAKRAELVSFIWGPGGLPKELPAKVDNAIQDDRYNDLTNLKQIDKLTVRMEWGLESIVYHFIPSQNNGKLLIYQGGHDGDFIVAKELIGYFLKNGFAVVALSMPLEPPNNRPVVELDRIGKIQIAFHEQLKILKMKAGHPVQLFFTPISCISQLRSVARAQLYLPGRTLGRRLDHNHVRSGRSANHS